MPPPASTHHVRFRAAAATGIGDTIRSSTAPASIALVGFVGIIALHVGQVIGDAAYTIVIFAAIGGAVLGLFWHRPSPAWPWWNLILAGALWALASVTADMMATQGVLSRDRSLIPDALSLPGYLLFGAALFGLLRQRDTTRRRDAVLDALMLASLVSLVVNEVLISPTLGMQDAWVFARLSVAIYPVLSLCIFTIALRLVFAPGGNPSTSYTLLLLGTASLLVGDVVFALGEIGAVDIRLELLDVPYLLVPACMGAAALHPSSVAVARPASSGGATLGRGRVLGVAIAMLGPVALLWFRRDGGAAPFAIGICAVMAVAAVVRIITAMRDQAVSAASMYHQATHDELTGLPGRQLLVERTDRMLDDYQRSGPVVVMFLDLDRFKFVNDSMGHRAGDELLKEVAARLLEVTGPYDVVARLSGDEFIVVVEDLDRAGADALAERIRSTLRGPFRLVDGDVFVSASVGFTVSQRGQSTGAAQMLREADTAMYRSKERGRDAVTMFDRSMQQQLDRRVDLERLLRRAVDEGGLDLAYQPIVEFPHGRVLGLEALARWTHNGVAVSPAEFIPIAEDSGLVVGLGRFVLDEACRNLAWWRANVPGAENLTMSVNVSPRQILSSNIVDTVHEILRLRGLPGDALWLELTERVMMEDSLTASSAMVGLRSLGVRLAIDDFGTGFSSLSYLKRFPVSRVKIDRSFVAGVGSDDADTSLVTAIIAMASALDLEPVAEGIESREQAERLQDLGCSSLQGYWISRPMDSMQTTAFLRRGDGRPISLAGSRPRSRRCEGSAI